MGGTKHPPSQNLHIWFGGIASNMKKEQKNKLELLIAYRDFAKAMNRKEEKDIEKWFIKEIENIFISK